MRNEINNVTESGGDIASVEIFDSYRVSTFIITIRELIIYGLQNIV